ncbi:MAG TPA: TraM recognition domain-containing protein [Alphaproteobacteria bacterium]
MVLNYRKHQPNINKDILKDARGDFAQLADKLRKKEFSALIFVMSAVFILMHPWILQISEILLGFCFLYFRWLHIKPQSLPFKMPKTANQIDPNNKAPGTGKSRKAEGILYLGTDQLTKEEIWFTNDDARTHVLYLGTTGSGKSEGLKAFATNALGWGSGFVYIDGKADTSLWGALSALARRYGRDDDLLILNYMTGNSDKAVASNSINPFALGSASYLTNLLVSLMPETQGDNAMWKDRAVALMAAVMPVLTWRRDVKEIPLSIDGIRDDLLLANIIKMSRDTNVPEKNRKEVKSYLNNLPGYRDEFFNDDGSPRSAANGQPNDTSTVEQQHGYLTMQFTKQMQSLAGDYGYIFLNPHADIDILDVVLNRRMLVVLIPALEKSADEAANLGKIIASLLKGMMGATLGSAVEGDTDMALENKPTTAPTPFMTIFDEVGYYATSGMAVMAAQARSLGFSMIFAGQDLPALEKRIKEEARSITANCNIKIFGKLEDPTQTKEFFEKTVGKALVLESGGRKKITTMFGSKIYDDSDSFTLNAREKADYDDLKGYNAGEAVVCFGDHLVKASMFFANPGKIKSLRVNRFIAILHPDPNGKRASRDVEAVLERFRDKGWTAENAIAQKEPSPNIRHLMDGFAQAREQQRNLVESGAYALTWMAWETELLKKEDIPDPNLETKAPSLESGQPASLAAPNNAVAPKMDLTAAVPATEKELVAAKETPPPAPAVKPERIEPTVMAAPDDDEPEPVKPLSARLDETDDEKISKATAESISWDSLLGNDTPKDESPAATKKESDPDNLSEEEQENIRKGTEETISWTKLLGEDPAPAPEAAPPAAPANIPKTSFGYGGFGTGGIGYATQTTQTTLAPAPASSPDTAAKPDIKDNSIKSMDEKDVEKALEDGQTIKWDDLL